MILLNLPELKGDVGLGFVQSVVHEFRSVVVSSVENIPSHSAVFESWINRLKIVWEVGNTSEEVDTAILLEEKDKSGVINGDIAVNCELDFGRVIANCSWSRNVLVSVEGGEDSGVAGKNWVVKSTVINCVTDCGSNSAL